MRAAGNRTVSAFVWLVSSAAGWGCLPLRPSWIIVTLITQGRWLRFSPGISLLWLLVCSCCRFASGKNDNSLPAMAFIGARKKLIHNMFFLAVGEQLGKLGVTFSLSQNDSFFGRAVRRHRRAVCSCCGWFSHDLLVLRSVCSCRGEQTCLNP